MLFQMTFLPCHLPPQQLAQWPLCLLLRSFRRLSMSINAGLAHIHFHWTAPHLGRSVRGGSCVCNLMNNVPCIPPLCFHPVLKVGCAGSEGPTSCLVYITPVLNKIQINLPVCQFLSQIWTSSYVTSQLCCGDHFQLLRLWSFLLKYS